MKKLIDNDKNEQLVDDLTYDQCKEKFERGRELVWLEDQQETPFLVMLKEQDWKQ